MKDENKLAWLSGIIDSDGCIGIESSRRKNDKIVYTPRITITNKNDLLLDEVHKILEHNNINHHIKTNGSCYNLTISRPSIIVNFMDLISSHLIVKKKEANLITSFCKSRLESISKNSVNHKSNYSDYEIQCVHEIKDEKLHRFSNFSDKNIIPSISWISGFIDGDGCLTINKIKRANGSYQYQPLISIVTESFKAKLSVSSFLEINRINYYLKITNSKYELFIREQNSCLKFCNLIKDFLISKKERAYRLINFINDSDLSKREEHYQDMQLIIKCSSTTKRKSFQEIENKI